MIHAFKFDNLMDDNLSYLGKTYEAQIHRDSKYSITSLMLKNSVHTVAIGAIPAVCMT